MKSKKYAVTCNTRSVPFLPKGKKDAVTPNNLFGTFFSKSKKGDVSQVFIYVFSIIIVVFASFMVISFVSSFLSSSEKYENSKFYQDFEKHFYSVYTTIGSEKVYKYAVSTKVELVCFVSDRDSISSIDMTGISNEDNSILETLYDGGSRIALFDVNTIINTHAPEYEFEAGESGAYCIKPRAGIFSLIYENRRGTVYISELD
ncbi:MAG: hypothetical protein PF569_09060 [Candidatus Woesearchaeota archaeon]|jgi:hypothetical protein|nr:hypothetical protein [Candidatus Woesearchaeota archaeon]